MPTCILFQDHLQKHRSCLQPWLSCYCLDSVRMSCSNTHPQVTGF